MHFNNIYTKKHAFVASCLHKYVRVRLLTFLCIFVFFLFFFYKWLLGNMTFGVATHWFLAWYSSPSCSTFAPSKTKEIAFIFLMHFTSVSLCGGILFLSLATQLRGGILFLFLLFFLLVFFLLEFFIKDFGVFIWSLNFNYAHKHICQQGHIMPPPPSPSSSPQSSNPTGVPYPTNALILREMNYELPLSQFIAVLPFCGHIHIEFMYERNERT